MQPHQSLVMGAVLAGLSVVTGAFGAHWLKSELPRRGLSETEQRKQLDNWDVAVRYQMYHALALIAIGVIPTTTGSVALRVAGVLFLVGIFIFSGSLYALVLSGIKVLGAIVPIGGVAMIAGWIAFAIGAVKR
jgi:uncharacterized membrane protein YgdD (TMEM256/DUF423 family)